MSFGPDFDEADDLAPIKAKFIELWAKHPDRSPREVADSAFRLCGVDPGFRFAQCADRWGADLEVLDLRDKARLTARVPDGLVPDKGDLLAEMLELARNPKTDPKDAHNLYRTILEAQGHITKQVDKKVNNIPPTPPAIVFKPVNFDRDPEPEESAA